MNKNQFTILLYFARAKEGEVELEREKEKEKELHRNGTNNKMAEIGVQRKDQ